ncbi:hypothetical protein Tco_1072569, partial [Tanacetum coccineum]
MRLLRHHLYLKINAQFRRTSLTGFPAQSVGSSNAEALNSPYLPVLIIRTSQSRQHDNLLKFNNYDNATKSLDKVIGSQLVDNNKKGLGYNVVPPPLTGLFAPPIIDLSHSGNEKFKESEFEGYRPKASKNVNTGAPIIEDWESDSDDENDKPKLKVVKKTVESKTVKQDMVSDG